MSDPKLAIVAELGRLAELNAGLRVRWQAIAGAIRAQMLPLIRDRPPEEVFPAMVILLGNAIVAGAKPGLALAYCEEVIGFLRDVVAEVQRERDAG